MSHRDIGILLIPEIVVVLGALVVLMVDMKLMRNRPNAVRMRMGALLTCVTCVGAICWLGQTGDPRNGLPDGMLVVSLLTQFLKQILLVLTLFTALISVRSDFTEHVGEFFVLILLATVGMMFMVSTENLLLIFVALELLSLSLYILTAFNKRNIRSAEAALKYFLFGGMSAAFLLFGLSLVYGLTGSIDLRGISKALQAQGGLDPLLLLAMIMTLTGLGFKVAAVPFHLWAPDAYEGAPAPSAAFIASGSKVASFFVLAQLMMAGFDGVGGSAAWGAFAPGWIALVSIMAVLSMVLGNLAAIVQKSVRRLLAYSAIAHAGYALLGVLANSEAGMASLLYYVTTYALTTLGAFAVVSVVQDQEGSDGFSAFAGLSKRSPLVAFCMMIFVLSLAGIPPLAGFFGKFYLFVEVAGHAKVSGLLWLVILAIAMSAVSLYYYLQVLKEIYVKAPAANAGSIDPGIGIKLTLAALALLVVVLGCLPNLLVGKLLAVIAAS